MIVLIVIKIVERAMEKEILIICHVYLVIQIILNIIKIVI